jgi:hypothetical protein
MIHVDVVTNYYSSPRRDHLLITCMPEKTSIIYDPRQQLAY